MSSNDIFGLDASKKMLEILEQKSAEAFGCTTSTDSTPKTLTLKDLEDAVRSVDPDGRMLQESRLLAECSRMSKDQVEAVILFAQNLRKWQDSMRNPFTREV